MHGTSIGIGNWWDATSRPGGRIGAGAGDRRALYIALAVTIGVVIALVVAIAPFAPTIAAHMPPARELHALGPSRAAQGTSTAVTNFTSSISRLVDLVAVAGGGVLALVWARVALSWFSGDISKKVQAKDRARDALIGTLIFTAAITGLVWGLAQWVISGV